MLRRGVIAIAIVLAELVAGCGGGSSSSAPAGPLLPWARERRNETNSGISTTAIDNAEGVATLLGSFTGVTPSGASPTLGRNTTAYLATSDGLLSLDADGNRRWSLEDCETGGANRSLGRIDSSATINFDGRDIIVGSSSGIYRFREAAVDAADGEIETPECIYAFPSPSSSSPLVLVDPADLSLLSIITGTTDNDDADNPVGRLVSIDGDGRRRWSFPTDEPFSGGLTSGPAFVGARVVFTAPNGLLYNLDLSGRLRWSARVGAPYDVPRIPSPAVFLNIYAVSAKGDIVAFSPTGRELWSFSPEAPSAGSVAVSGLATLSGTTLGQNVVFSVDTEGLVYGVGASDGELIRFCESTNRACLQSTCADDGDLGPADCEEVEEEEMRCSGPDPRTCSDSEPCDEGETCGRFFCSNDPTEACFQDTCIFDQDTDDETFLPESNRCRRPAMHPLSTAGDDVVVATAPILSTDSFVVATTTDGRVCARRLDGSVPNGRCCAERSESSLPNGRCEPGAVETGEVCAPDSCVEGDECCIARADGGAPDCKVGFCVGDPSQQCSRDTCREGKCITKWRNGCITLDDNVGLASPVVDGVGNILVTTEKGLVRIE